MVGLASVSEEYSIYQYSAMAYIDTEVIQTDVNIFRELLKQNSNFAKEIIDILSSNSVQIYGRFFASHINSLLAVWPISCSAWLTEFLRKLNLTCHFHEKSWPN